MQLQSIYENYLGATGISTDTRSLNNGEIFFALRGENFNGNLFAEKAISLGASKIIVDDEKLVKLSPKIILVKDTLKTLQTLATFHRNKLQTTIIGITGSNGKTTTKELIKKVLAKKYNVLATEGNLNNHIGVPLSLLKLKEHHEVAIIEMGANHIKEIKFLCNIAQPNWGYITNFGKAHIEGFGSLEGVIKGKSELYDHLVSRKQKILINGDDRKQIDQTKNYPTTSYGKGDNNNIQILPLINKNLKLQLSFKKNTFTSSLYGEYNLNNIAAAISFGYLFDIPLEAIKKAIAAYRSTNYRSQEIQIKHTLVLMDAYNANPSSMKLALEAFEKIATSKSAVILGDMLELGATSIKEHEDIIARCLNYKLKRIYLVGSNFSSTKTENETVTKYKDLETLFKFLESKTLTFDQLLIKGSRYMKLERVLPFLESKL
ncbi:MAG: UDP-N-acetylmuramoyl-tripeptide--D-alanyl-D-alanine ligase [Flavobacteriaceae bacterium]|jgi:UDP-N-acetylmuramoyl-tripeptide--D-alanyl-D-alanine ligase|tara:strand:- start:3599 stop:4897 length:1299 start_codon:yes stop_codon:yes gene_type:complete